MKTRPRLKKSEQEVCTLSYLNLRNLLLEYANGKKVTGRHVSKACQLFGSIQIVNDAGGFAELAFMLKQLGMNNSSISREIKKVRESVDRMMKRAKDRALSSEKISQTHKANDKKEVSKKDLIPKEKEPKSVFVSIRMTAAEREKLNTWVNPRKRTEYIRACIGLND